MKGPARILAGLAAATSIVVVAPATANAATVAATTHAGATVATSVAALKLGCKMAPGRQAHVLTGISGNLTPASQSIAKGKECHWIQHGTPTDVGFTVDQWGRPGRALYNSLMHAHSRRVGPRSLRLRMTPDGIAPAIFTVRWSRGREYTLSWRGEHPLIVAEAYFR
jgi:hypothetical protein